MDSLLVPILLGLAILIFILGFSILAVIGFILLERTKEQNPSTPMVTTGYTDTAQSFPGPGLYRSMDGKYSANTLDDLVQQMVDDGQIDPNSGEPEELRRFFENLSNEDEEDDDDDEEDKPWLLK
jgi:hypothetical protein